MDLTTARQTVINDVRESYPEMSEDEALAYGLNTAGLFDFMGELEEAYKVAGEAR